MIYSDKTGGFPTVTYEGHECVAYVEEFAKYKTVEDRAASGKLTQYEKLLEQYSYDDVLQKTNRCKLPKIRHLPVELEYYDRGELADYVQEQIRDLMQEEASWEEQPQETKAENVIVEEGE